MKRLLAIVGAVVLTAVLATPMQAAKSLPPFAFDTGGSGQFDLTIEQLSDYPYSSANEHYVRNPGLCDWDINDRWSVSGYGTLAGTTSIDHCLIADYSPVYRTLNGQTAWWSSRHLSTGVEVRSSAPVSVALCFDQQARCFTPTPTYVPAVSGKNHAAAYYLYQLCVQVVYDEPDSALTPIVGSGFGTAGDGKGVLGSRSLTITSDGPVTLQAAFAGVSGSGLGTDVGPGCPADRTTQAEVYPFRVGP